jgi:hypothetical protein
LEVVPGAAGRSNSRHRPLRIRNRRGREGAEIEPVLGGKLRPTLTLRANGNGYAARWLKNHALEAH